MHARIYRKLNLRIPAMHFHVKRYIRFYEHRIIYQVSHAVRRRRRLRNAHVYIRIFFLYTTRLIMSTYSLDSYVHRNSMNLFYVTFARR